jgi:hypothetical protein
MVPAGSAAMDLHVQWRGLVTLVMARQRACSTAAKVWLLSIVYACLSGALHKHECITAQRCQQKIALSLQHQTKTLIVKLKRRQSKQRQWHRDAYIKCMLQCTPHAAAPCAGALQV